MRKRPWRVERIDIASPPGETHWYPLGRSRYATRDAAVAAVEREYMTGNFVAGALRVEKHVEFEAAS